VTTIAWSPQFLHRRGSRVAGRGSRVNRNPPATYGVYHDFGQRAERKGRDEACK